MRTIITYTQNQIERATELSKKSPATFEAILKMIAKQDEKKGWKQMTKKDIERIESKKRIAEMPNPTASECQNLFEQQIQNQKKLL